MRIGCTQSNLPGKRVPFKKNKGTLDRLSKVDVLMSVSYLFIEIQNLRNGEWVG